MDFYKPTQSADFQKFLNLGKIDALAVLGVCYAHR